MHTGFQNLGKKQAGDLTAHDWSKDIDPEKAPLFVRQGSQPPTKNHCNQSRPQVSGGIQASLGQRAQKRNDRGDRQTDENGCQIVIRSAQIAALGQRKDHQDQQERAQGLHGSSQGQGHDRRITRKLIIFAKYLGHLSGLWRTADNLLRLFEGCNRRGEERVEEESGRDCPQELGQQICRHFSPLHSFARYQGQSHSRIEVGRSQ